MLTEFISTKILKLSYNIYINYKKKTNPERDRWVSNSVLIYNYYYKSILNIVYKLN